MLTGRQALQNLETGLSSVKTELSRIDLELAQISQALTTNQQKQSRTLQKLARVRLDEIQSGSLVSLLDQADREILKILQQRESALDDLGRSVDAADHKIDQLERERAEHAQRVEKSSQDVIDAEHKVQSKLEYDDGYQDKLNKARIADSIADEAEEKAALAERDRIEKGSPFEKDDLFYYLWKRHYGTSEYRANLLIRALDDWVARLCRYEKGRVNYWTLLEIPKRLKEHAENVRRAAEIEVEGLKDLEQQAALETRVPDLQQALEDAEGELKQHDARITETEDSRNKLIEQRTVFVSGQDEFSQSCVKLLADVMEHSDVHELNRTVHLTQSREDDLLARDLLELREEKDDFRRDLAESRQRHDKQLQRLKELEEVRRQFKDHHYDDMRSGFNNKALIVSVLSQFLNGMISDTDLWGTIRRHQRHRDVGAWPDFGSGGLGGGVRRSGGNVWHRPGSKTGGSFRLPRNGGFSSRSRGGGFRTGGGF